MPIHLGHIALIRYAAQRCDELIVSMSFTPSDPIDASLRFSWVIQTFTDDPKIKPAMVEDNFDDESLPLAERTRIWASFIQRAYPPVDRVFSSEEYGLPLARHLGAEHFMFDPRRNQIPVSASKIRHSPLRYWEFIPQPAKPYFVKKICFYGPESTGKSSMTVRMADLYNTTFVPEVAREMLITNDFSVDDIVRIGTSQYERIQQNVKSANKFLMCDTDAITTQIYSQYYLGTVPPVLYELEKKVSYAHYFLFDIDVPWVGDGLRDLGHLRSEMFSIFKKALDDRNIDYTFVTGHWHQREAIVRATLDKLLV